MKKIEFDEPSRGNVNSAETALEINQSGEGGAILAISKKSIGITVEAGTVFGESGIALYAVGHGQNATGIDARCDNGIAVKGTSLNQSGIYGKGKDAGVSGESDGIGVKGVTRGKYGIGVHGEADSPEGGAGVVGVTKSWIGVHGISKEKGGHGVMGEVQHTEGGAGVIGKSKNWIGVHGESEKKIGVLGKGPIAGRFEGDVEVTGDVKLINADCAEDFSINEQNVEPGTVMVLTENGSLQSSYQEYDKKVAGIVSGAHGYKPGIVLDSHKVSDPPREINEKERLPIALMGKVYCKVDARQSPVEIGDLLTTSRTKGYAMKAEDLNRAFGTVVGKALGSIKEGLGMIPILVTLQ